MILETTGNEQAKSHGTRAIESSVRRKFARALKKGDFAPLENPDAGALCPFWLGKVEEKATQHTGPTERELVSGVQFVKGGW